MIPGQPDDVVGLGYFYSNFSDELQGVVAPQADFEDEQGAEVFYNLATTPFFKLIADLQWIDPGNGSDPARLARRAASRHQILDFEHNGLANNLNSRSKFSYGPQSTFKHAPSSSRRNHRRRALREKLPKTGIILIGSRGVVLVSEISGLFEGAVSLP